MVTYLKDTNALEYYDASTWRTVGLDTTVAGSVIAFGSTAVSAAYTAVAGLDNGSIIVTGTAAVTVTVPDVLSIGD